MKSKMLPEKTSRRRFLLAGASLGAFAFGSRNLVALESVGRSGKSWEDALGWALVPMETEEQFEAWREQVWTRLPDEKWNWLTRFEQDVNSSSGDISIDDAERACQSMLDSRQGPKFNSFITKCYHFVATDPTLMALLFPAGTYFVGRASPDFLAGDFGDEV